MAEHNKLENRYWVKKLKYPRANFMGKPKEKKKRKSLTRLIKKEDIIIEAFNVKKNIELINSMFYRGEYTSISKCGRKFRSLELPYIWDTLPKSLFKS